MRHVIAVAVMFALLGCGVEQHYADAVLDPNPERDTLLKSWYARHLDALGEVPLERADGETYRFLWLRTFHEPVAVRVELRNGVGTLFLKVADGAGGYDPGKLITNSQRLLTTSEVAQLSAVLQRTNFWSLAPYEEKDVIIDGARWVVEGTSEDRHHVVQRHSPVGGPVRDLGMAFLALTGRRFEVY